MQFHTQNPTPLKPQVPSPPTPKHPPNLLTPLLLLLKPASLIHRRSLRFRNSLKSSLIPPLLSPLSSDLRRGRDVPHIIFVT